MFQHFCLSSLRISEFVQNGVRNDGSMWILFFHFICWSLSLDNRLYFWGFSTESGPWNFQILCALIRIQTFKIQWCHVLIFDCVLNPRLQISHLLSDLVARSWRIICWSVFCEIWIIVLTFPSSFLFALLRPFLSFHLFLEGTCLRFESQFKDFECVLFLF